MLLSIKERFLLNDILPKQENTTSLLIVRDILKKIVINQEEAVKIELKDNPDGKGCGWNPDKAKDSEIQFTQMEIYFLKKLVKELNKKKLITLEILDLCLRIKNIN